MYIYMFMYIYIYMYMYKTYMNTYQIYEHELISHSEKPILKSISSRPMRRPSALVLGSPVIAPMVWWKSPKYGSTPMRRLWLGYVDRDLNSQARKMRKTSGQIAIFGGERL